MMCHLMVSSQLLNLLLFLTVKILNADFLYATTEDVEYFKNYDGTNGEQNCDISCSSYCEEKKKNGVKVDCFHIKGKFYWTCRCKETIPITEYTCLASSNQCRNFNFLPVYRDGKCYCTCTNSNCDRVCEKKGKLGKCKPQEKQKLNEDSCECYCEQAECAQRRSSNFRNANCNTDGNCHFVCNGTQASVPGWCKLYSDRCGCACAKSECQKYATKNSNKPYGVCNSEKKCNLQFTTFSDELCVEYCKRRTGDTFPPTVVPSSDGNCKCRFSNTNLDSYKSCVQSAVCSKNDYSFCQDDPHVSNIAKAEQTPCSGKLCWSPILNGAQNISRPWVYATPKMESETNFQYVLCRVNKPSIGFAELRKVEQSYASCKFVHIPFDGKFDSFSTKYHALLGNKYTFKAMKKNDPIPKTAFVQDGVYFGRDLTNNVFGSINASGIMTGGHLYFQEESGLEAEWGEGYQIPVYPDTFEILVCTD